MAWSRKSKPKARRVVLRKLRDGSVKKYEYASYKPKEKPRSDTVAALIEAYSASPEWRDFSPATQTHRTIYMRCLSDLRDTPVGGVKRRDIIAIHDAMRTERGDGAASGFLRTAAALFSWGIEKEWLEHSPTLKVRSAPGGHYRAWSVAEADAAEKLLPEHYRRVVVLGRHTGQRRGDLCAMRWDQFDGKAIRLVQQKTKAALVIPATPTLKLELDAWKREASALTILTNQLGKPWDPQRLSLQLPLIMARRGIASDLNVHGLRKLAAAELANAGCTTHEVAAITGHRTLAMVELYTRSADQERLADAAVLRLQNYRKKSVDR